MSHGLFLRSKGQLSVEYLVILGVAVIGAFIVVNIFSEDSQVASNLDTASSKSYWRTAEIGVLDWKIYDNGTAYITVRNNAGDRINLQSFKVGGQELLSSDLYMNMGATKTISGVVTPGSGFYSMDVQTSYEVLT